VYDADSNAAVKALNSIKNEKLPMLKNNDLLNGQTVDAVFKRIHVAKTLKDALTGAYYIQENVPENLELKRKVFKQLTDTVAELSENLSFKGFFLI
jgi:L-gulonate 3-dehydrogenase